MRTFLLTIGLLAMAMPALACGMSQTSAQSGQQTPLPVASSDQHTLPISIRGLKMRRTARTRNRAGIALAGSLAKMSQESTFRPALLLMAVSQATDSLFGRLKSRRVLQSMLGGVGLGVLGTITTLALFSGHSGIQQMIAGTLDFGCTDAPLNKEQRDFLELHGCHAYQGNLFSRPLPLEEFEDFLKRV